jgi:hypothetical protein
MTTVPVQVPESLYRRLERAAVATRRSVPDVLATSLAITLPPMADLPEAVAHELAAMTWLNDEALRAATQPTLTIDQQQRLSELNDLADRQPLSDQAQTEREILLAEYDRSMLRRAQAFAILAQRGYPVPAYANLAHAA